MTRVEREALKKRIVNYYLNIAKNDKTAVFRHFNKEKISKSTIYSIIAAYLRTGKVVDQPRCGRPLKLSRLEMKRIDKSFRNKDGKSLRVEARKYGVCPKTIGNYLKKLKISYRKKEKAPMVSQKQLPKIIRASRKLATKTFVGKSVVIDDEKYFTFSNSNVSGNDGYYTDIKEKTPDDVRFKQKSKFEPKVLVWLAISDKGMSKSYIQTSSNAIKSNIYISKCLRSKLVPFIKEHHNDGNYVFWPDLASSHYAQATMDFLDEKKIIYVPKGDNPPNVPQARPIENFWGDLSRRVYENGWQAKTKSKLIRRINSKLKEFDLSELQNHMKLVRYKLRKIADNGPYSVYK